MQILNRINDLQIKVRYENLIYDFVSGWGCRGSGKSLIYISAKLKFNKVQMLIL